nr:MAG TPA: hypothetical protein [Caudoviricetes sp.]
MGFVGNKVQLFRFEHQNVGFAAGAIRVDRVFSHFSLHLFSVRPAETIFQSAGFSICFCHQPSSYPVRGDVRKGISGPRNRRQPGNPENKTQQRNHRPGNQVSLASPGHLADFLEFCSVVRIAGVSNLRIHKPGGHQTFTAVARAINETSQGLPLKPDANRHRLEQFDIQRCEIAGYRYGLGTSTRHPVAIQVLRFAFALQHHQAGQHFRCCQVEINSQLTAGDLLQLFQHVSNFFHQRYPHG